MGARTWLAVLLSLGVWFAWEQWFGPKPPVRDNKAVSSVAQTSPQTTTTSSAPTLQSASGPFSAGIPTQEDYWIKTADFEIAFSDVGGQVARVNLPKFRDNTVDPKVNSPVSVVSREKHPYSLSMLFDDRELSSLNAATFQRTVQGNTVTYRTTSSSGVSLTKVYEVLPATYEVKAQYVVRFADPKNQAKGYIALPVGGKQLVYDLNVPLKSWETVTYQNESVRRTHLNDLPQSPEVYQGNTAWLAFGNRYFSSIIRNETKLNPDVVFQSGLEFSGGYLRYPISLKESDQEMTLSVSYLLAPKDYALLSKTPGLRKLIDYGMFSVVAYPLLDLLRFFYKFVGNYGIAIILLTILVRLLFYPLSLQSFKSMKEMQKLQPKIAEIKEKYGEDRERFQREQMALFKTHKVNPFGGCLPILVQIPVFIALYAVLGNSIELFQAPFFGWVKDLSAKDPWYVFPVLMGISMVVQQKITPTVGMDPVQQKIMMFMPVVFSFMMLSLPAGLTVYMFVSTLLGIVQQWIISKSTGSTAVAVKSAPATEA